MPALDLSALSPEVTLLGATIVAGPRSQLTSTPVTGFSDVASATIVVKVERVDNNNGEALSVTVQGSDDGNSWSTVAGPYSFTRDGTESLVVDDPADRLRVAWSAPRGVREAAIGSVTARLGVVDAPGGESGGSQPVSLAYTDLAFDTPGLFPQQFEITAVDGNVVTVAGDRRSLFPAGSMCAFAGITTGRLVIGSTLVGGDTEVEADDAPGVTPGDFLANTGTAGVTVATLAAGDILHLPTTSLWIPTAWNGSTPTLHFGPGETGAQGQYEFGSNVIDLTAADNDSFADGDWWQAQASPNAWGNEEYRAGAATTARVYVDDSGGGDPGSTAGTAIIALPIWRKP